MNDNHDAAQGLMPNAPTPAGLNIDNGYLPSIFTIELTQLCNNACSGCANVDIQRHKADVSNQFFIHNWADIIHKIAPYAKIIRLSGGEPTLHPEFEDIVRLVDIYGIKHALFTTARWQSKKKKPIIDLYRDCRYTAGMLISLHGADAASHHAFIERASNAFTETCANIRLATSNGINVFISTVLTKLNCTDIQKIIEKSISLGANHVVFNRFLAVNHRLLPGVNQLRDALETIQALRLQGYPCRIGNSIPPCFLPNAIEVAKAGYELCHISTKGSLRPDNLTNISFGNLLTKNIPGIWQSPVAEAYRKAVHPTCPDCSAFLQCRGGSKSLQIEYNLPGDPLMQRSLDQFVSSGDGDPKDAVFLALTSD